MPTQIDKKGEKGREEELSEDVRALEDRRGDRGLCDELGAGEEDRVHRAWRACNPTTVRTPCSAASAAIARASSSLGTCSAVRAFPPFRRRGASYTCRLADGGTLADEVDGEGRRSGVRLAVFSRT
jgi:hypothetical protein